MKPKKRTIRDQAAENLEMGVIGALIIVIVAFLSLGNASIKSSVRMTSKATPVEILPPTREISIPQPPPPAADYGVIKEVSNPKEADTVAFIPEPWEPDSTRINAILGLDNLELPPLDATYPVLLTKLDIKYPERLSREGIEGEVDVWIGLDKEGRVIDVCVARSSGFSEFDSLAVKAVRKARFSPALQNGIPLPVKVIMPVSFKLD
ncbi:energy transducer TonB [candidate division WOR-3 bacterium]|nr:energy transducer TonB [candidate division WOR-3 bacterium]